MKRLHGSGSVSRLSDGRYLARLPLSLVRRQVGIYASEHEASAALCKALAAAVERPPETLTLDGWGLQWLADRRAGGMHRSPKSDEDTWRLRVSDAALGSTPVRDVRAQDVRRWLGSLRGRGVQTLAPQTQRNALNLVRGALKHAVELGILNANPARDIALPKVARAGERDQWTWLTAPEADAVIAAVGDLRRRSLITVAIYSGLRAGELAALRWQDVDHARGVLVVAHARTEDGRLGPPKGGRSREVPMLRPVSDALEAWEADLARRASRRADRGFVWPARDGGMHARGYSAGLRSWLAAAGVERRVRFHDLRHTCASHLLQGTWAPDMVARAMRLEEVRDWLGHADVTVTQRYAHLAQGGLVALIGGQIGGFGPKREPLSRFELETYGLRNRCSTN